MEKYIFYLSIFILFVSIVVVIYYRIKTQRLLKSLSSMLDRAIAGEFKDTVFDESMYSALEVRLARFIYKNSLSTQALCAERDKIKELIADISHQTKTPLSNIELYSQLLSESNMPEGSKKKLDFIISQSQKLDFLITSLIKLSRLETGILSVVPKKNSVASMLSQVKESLMPMAKAKLIELSINCGNETAVFDMKWTTEAIYNIVDNAVKYTPAYGSVSINVIQYEMFCRIDISDTGIGISESEQPRIFQRFYRSPFVSDIEGVGIGLFLSREIITAENGYIKVSSKEGSGTTFSVFLCNK